MVALKLLESVLGKVATIGIAGYLFGWLCFIACVICTLAKAAQWRDVAGYCAFLLGGSSMLIAVGFLGLAVIGHIQHKRYVKGGKVQFTRDYTG